MRRDVSDSDAARWQVFLDGKALAGCVTADDNEGWAEVYKTALYIKRILAYGGEQTEILYGKVEFRYID